MNEESIDYINRYQDKGIISQEDANNAKKYVSYLKNNNVPVIYDLRHIKKIFEIPTKEQDLFFGEDRYKNYEIFFIPKKSGKWREIEAPKEKLKIIQRWIKDNILDKILLSNNAKGFKCNTSIIDNAIPHINKELVINLDLKNFFPSIKYNQIFTIFKNLGYSIQVSNLLTKLCTNNKNVLPQGSPASPVISNIVCLNLDKRLKMLNLKANSNYTRYADDMTFSGSKKIKRYLCLIKKIVEDEGFVINESKTRLAYSYQKQEVTGIIVNKKLSVSKRLIEELEKAIYYCNKFGVGNHMKNINCERSFYKEHLYGLAYFINMVDKEKGQSYIESLNNVQWNY